MENVTEEVTVETESNGLMDLASLAEFATKPVYRSQNNAKKLYEYTVVEARELVKVRDQNKVKKDGIVALGLNLGRNLLALDKIKAKATRLVVSDNQVEGITEALIAHVANGVFDEEIAESLAKTKATAAKMEASANKKNEVDAEIPLEADSINGLGEIEDIGSDIEQL